MGAAACKGGNAVAFDDPMKIRAVKGAMDSVDTTGTGTGTGTGVGSAARQRAKSIGASVAGSELLDTESLLNASEAVIFGHALSRQSFTHSNLTDTTLQNSVGYALNDLTLGQVCAALVHIEDLQRLEVTELSPEVIRPDDPRYNAAQYFIKVGLSRNKLCLVEMCKTLTQRKINECNNVKPEWHEEASTAIESAYKNIYCMHCDAMLSKERDWVPHWSVPPGPPVEAVLDPVLGSSIASYSTCASGISTQSMVNLATQRKCDDNHLFLEYLAKNPEVQLLTSAISADTLVVMKYTRPCNITKKLCRELAILKSIIHQNITPLLEAIVEGSNVITFTVFVPGGVLYRPFDPPFNMDTLRLHTLGLLHGLHYLHFLGLVHGNIKYSNVLVDGNGRAVLCDVGTLHGFRDKESDLFGFMSPSGNKVPVCDVWSLGVLTYCMAVGKPPFPYDKPDVVRRYLMKSDPDYRVIPCMILRDLLRGMLERRDTKRMSVRDCVEHPFFSEVSIGVPEYPAVAVTPDEIQKALTNNPLDFCTTGFKKVSRKFPGRRLAAEGEDATQRSSIGSILNHVSSDKGEVLNLSGLALTALPERALNECQWVKKIDLSDNSLTTIPVDLVRFGALQSITLRKNELSTVSVDIFTIASLTFLDLSENSLSSLPDIPPSSVLLTVSLDNNHFNMVPETLTNLDTLLQVHLRGNRVLHLPMKWKWTACKLYIDNTPGIVHEIEHMDIPKGLDIAWNRIYPEKLVDYLYIGSLRTVQEEYVLRQLGVDHIVTVGKTLGVIDPLPTDMEHTRVNLDVRDTHIHQLLDDITSTIHELVTSHRTVVLHCLSGQNRSVVVACAYFIRYYNLPFKEAIKRVKVIRPAANPNEGFRRHLIDFEALQHGTRLTSDDVEAMPNDITY